MTEPTEQKPTRRLDSPNCSTCAHFRPEPAALAAYPHCVAVNVREGWGQMTYMPVEPEEVCHRHEEARRAA